MSEPVINEDELIGFIARKAYEDGEILRFDEIASVLKYQMMFYKEKGLIETEKHVDKDELDSMVGELGNPFDCTT